jgi:flagellar hook-associated protein 2
LSPSQEDWKVAAIRFGGMASGLPPNIVEQIMEAEKIPVKTMETTKSKSEDRLKLVNDLETKVGEISKTLGELVGTRGFAQQKLVSGDPNIVNGEIDPETSVAGNWNVEVVQLAQKPSAISNGFPDKDKTEVGVGYFSFSTPEGTKEVYVNKGSSTLEGVVKAINAGNVGLRASILTDRADKENPYRLLVSGLATGDEKQVSFPTLYLLDGDQDMYFDQSKPAQNGKVKVDGFEVEVPENRITDLIPGMTIDLKQAAPGREVNISVKEDTEMIVGKIKSFVDAYNGVLSFIQSQNKLSEKSDTSRTLGGDGMLRTIENNLRRAIINPQMGINSSISRVSELGITFNRSGTLELNQEKFNSMLAKKTVDVQNFLRGDNFAVGFVPTIRREVGNLVNGVFGPISLKKKGLQDKINQVNSRIESKERQLVKREESLRRQFSNLEQKMSQLKQQGGAVGAMGNLGVGAQS